MRSFIKEFFSRKEETVQFSYEEKRYPFGVKVLVALLAFLLFMLAQRAISDLSEEIPEIPYPHYEEILEVEALRIFDREKLIPARRQWERLEFDLEQSMEQYDARLLEKIAGEEGSPFGPIEELRGNVGELTIELEDVRTTFEELEVEAEKLREAAEVAQKPLLRAYGEKIRWRQAKVFVWESLFLIPFFAFALFWYTRSKRRESWWEIVSLATLIAASLVSLQCIGVLLCSWIPNAFFEWLWEILQATLLTRILGYYLLMAIVIFLFGGLIGFIYRRVTDPVRGGKRKIRHSLCPTCSYPLGLSRKHCGGCGKELVTPCTSCGKDGYIWQAVCVHCGK